jgi:FlaG/FlaF family flagellin (archaellin)
MNPFVIAGILVIAIVVLLFAALVAMTLHHDDSYNEPYKPKRRKS